MSRSPYTSQFYNIDCFAFTVFDEIDKNGEKICVILRESLGYDLAEFETIPGRYFYNSGLTLVGYVNIYYNDYEQELARNTYNSRNYVFTVKGCKDLAQNIEKDWVGLFQIFIYLS